MTHRILIVDDEPPARRRLRELLSDLAEKLPHTIVGEAPHGAEGLALVKLHHPTVVIADLEMPGMSGIDFARQLAAGEPPAPGLIFVTAHTDYAFDAFQVNAVDYLLKPIRAERLFAAFGKCAGAPAPPAVLSGNLAIRSSGKVVLVPLRDILYFKAELKYVTVRTVGEEYIFDGTLAQLEENYAPHFLRISRNVLVARARIRAFQMMPYQHQSRDEQGDHQWHCLIQDWKDPLPVSRRQWSNIRADTHLTEASS